MPTKRDTAASAVGGIILFCFGWTIISVIFLILNNIFFQINNMLLIGASGVFWLIVYIQRLKAYKSSVITRKKTYEEFLVELRQRIEEDRQRSKQT